MEATEAGVLIRLLRKAVGRLPETGQGPSVIGRVTMKWSEPESKDSEITLVASSGWVILAISSGEESIEDPYLATFGYKTVEDFVAALLRGIAALDSHNQAPRAVTLPG